MTERYNSPQIKICGLTRVDEAVKCAELGADAIGCVFYSKSPRNVSVDEAENICRSLPENIITVGLFVNESFSFIMHRVKACGLKSVQLHGQESFELVEALRKENILVIKALFAERKPELKDADKYNASAYLVECGKGKLPGGNAVEWDWKKAKAFGEKYPFVLAGGLKPDNVCQAVSDSVPDAVDVSSGVESFPGRKDPGKVEAFIKAVSGCVFDKEKARKLRIVLR